MLNKEALAAVVKGFSVDPSTMDKAMIDRGVEPEDTYSAADAKKIDLCAISVLESIQGNPNVSEGGYSISFNADALKARLEDLRSKWGVSSVPTLRYRNVR